MIATGKRHPFLYRYTVGFDGEGRVLALDAMLAADAGWSLDLTPGVVARALTHTDNAYWIPHFRAVGYACKTHKQSNTAFRGFGGPQGVVVMEDALDRIALQLGRDPDRGPRAQFLQRRRRRDAVRPEGRGQPSCRGSGPR